MTTGAEGASLTVLFLLAMLVAMILSGSIRILREYERGVIFRLGRLIRTKGPGLIFLIPIVDRMVRISLRVIVMEVPPQDVITKDNVSIKVSAVIYFQVIDASKAVVGVENYLFATSQLSQTTLRSMLGQSELDELLSEREIINKRLQESIGEHTAPWGIKVAMVELKNVDLPAEMQRAIARQAEAERERRAKVIHAQGEFEASIQLANAANNISAAPAALQLRYLQTLTEVAAEKNSTTIFPVPLDMFKPFFEIMEKIKTKLDS